MALVDGQLRLYFCRPLFSWPFGGSASGGLWSWWSLVAWLYPEILSYRYISDKGTKFGRYLLYISENDFGVEAQKIKFPKSVKFNMASKMAAQTTFSHGFVNT